MLLSLNYNKEGSNLTTKFETNYYINETTFNVMSFSAL